MSESIESRSKIPSAEAYRELRTIIDCMSEGLIIIGPDGKVVDMNPAALRIFRYDTILDFTNHLSEVLTSTKVYTLDGKLLAPGEWPISRLRRGEEFKDIDVRVERTDINYGWIGRYCGSTVNDSEGRLIHGIMTVQDTTREHRVEEQLLGTLKSIGDGFFACDAEWRFVYVNGVAEKLLGLDKATILGKNHWEVFPLALDTKIETEYRLAAAGSVRDFEMFYVPWQRWFHNRCYPRPGGGMSVYFQDITELKLDEQELVKRRSAEKEIELHKREFYRRTIYAATDGKLLMSEYDEIANYVGTPITTWPLNNTDDVKEILTDLGDRSRQLGLEQPRVYEYLGCICEALSNVLKHAGKGVVCLHFAHDSIICVVADKGSGIAAMALPDVALTRGYSTAGTLGMGYKLMLHFADEIRLATGVNGTTVAVVIKVHKEVLSDVEQIKQVITNRSITE